MNSSPAVRFFPLLLSPTLRFSNWKSFASVVLYFYVGLFLSWISGKKSSLFGKSLRRFPCVIEWVSLLSKKILESQLWKAAGKE